jgi:hypothetical protein
MTDHRPTAGDTWRALAEMMRGSHLLAPHSVPAYVARHAADLGFADARLYLADLQQQQLVPFLPGGAQAAEHQLPQGIDSTLAGRAFQHVAVLSHDDGSSVRAWVPLLDGTERLGVLAVVLPDAAALDAQTDAGQLLRLFAALVSDLVVTKTQYGDSMVRVRRTASMGLAAEIQWSLLPPLTFADRDVSIAGTLEPAYSVAGDSVDYSVDADAARLAVFDGMGHGLTSAQLVGVVVAAYRNARRAGLGLSDTCDRIEESVSEAFDGDAFVTGLLAELDPSTGALRWVSAGHPAPLLLRHGRLVKALELPPRLPFGLGLDRRRDGRSGLPPLQIGTEQLEPADFVLLYTDGVVEARSPHGELFGVERLTDLIVRNLAAGLPAAETMRRTVAALLQHQGGELADDATMLLAQWRPPDLDALLP